MTLKELSPLYLESARLISERMSLLRRQRRETDDPQERFRLERRLLELRYLHGASVEDICVRLNMERMQVWRVQGSALEHFREGYEAQQGKGP